nr:Os06g0343500 protein [Ipomoea batatas]
MGHVTIGTPCHMLSRVEFQPQWDTKAPVAWWARTSTCGAHPQTFPLFLVLSANPGGKIGSKLVKSLARSELVKDHGRRMDHKNLWPLLSSAVAIWCICGASNPPWLPKQRNTTDDGGCSESQGLDSHFFRRWVHLREVQVADSGIGGNNILDDGVGNRVLRIGHVTIGTPCHILSRVEFQPQWDTNAAVARWARTSTCGAHPQTFPLFLVLSVNPGGKIGTKLVKSPARSELVKDHGRRMDHKNLWPLLSSAVAIWCICGASNPPWLPKQRNTTDEGGCSESQLMISSFPACSF